MRNSSARPSLDAIAHRENVATSKPRATSFLMMHLIAHLTPDTVLTNSHHGPCGCSRPFGERAGSRLSVDVARRVPIHDPCSVHLARGLPRRGEVDAAEGPGPIRREHAGGVDFRGAIPAEDVVCR